MTADAFLLVRNRGNGVPDPSGTLGHFVRVTQNPHSTSINQLTAGGRFPQDDCAPAVLFDRLLDDGKLTRMTYLEQLCGTQGNGTFATGVPSLQNGAALLGYATTWIAGACPAGFVDNPAWGGIIAPAGFAPYAAAAIGYLRIDTPGAWQAQPGPTQEDDMFALELGPGDQKFIGGPDGATDFNLCAQGDTPNATSVTLIAYDYRSGVPLGSKNFTCYPNVPNQRGPVQQFGTVADVSGSSGPATLLVWNNGPGRIIVTFH